MEGNTPGRGSGVSGEGTEGLENYFMTPSDKELVRGARERFHLIEELDQVNREIRVITSEVSQFGGLSGETKKLLSGLRSNVDESSNEVRKHLENLCHQRDFIIARLKELREANEKAAEYPARMNHLLGTGGVSEMGGRALPFSP